MAETKDLLVTLEDLKVVHDDHVSKFAGKVDKVDGKGLSSNDYDDAAKAKVDAIPDNPKYTDTIYNDSELQEAVNQLNSNLQSTVGNLSELNTQEKTSLVAAINEALTKSGGEIAPDDVQRIVEDYLKANPPGTGADGKDGITPTIGENGNWYLGDTDTGKPSRGTTGTNGKDGTAGKDGITPTIGENGNWYLGDTDTGKPSRGAAGTNGKDGASGKDGAAGSPGITPHIGENGNWYLGDTDTGKPSRGADGTKGDKGDNAYVWIRYAAQKPTAASHSFGVLPDNWMGVYSGNSATAPTDWTKYQWFEITGAVSTVSVSATLTVAGWSTSAPYTQSVTVSGLADTKRAMAYPVYGSNTATNLALKEACGMVSFASRSGSVLTFTCLEDKPTVNIPITVEVYV